MINTRASTLAVRRGPPVPPEQLFVNAHVVRLMGVPYETSEEDVEQFFNGE